MAATKPIGYSPTNPPIDPSVTARWAYEEFSRLSRIITLLQQQVTELKTCTGCT